MDLREHLTEQMKRHIISKNITCDVTGAVLDIRTAVWILDLHGDPMIPVSPEGWDLRKEKLLPQLEAKGFAVEDPREPK